MAKLTAKQQLFCDEYLIDLNATQAAIRAGYSAKYAHTNASKLLQITTIRDFINKRMAEKEDALIAKQDEVLKYFTSVMRGKSTSSVLARDEMGADRVIEKPPDEKEKLKAAEQMGKYYALFTEKVEQDVDLELHIKIDYGDGEDDEDGEDDDCDEG